MEYSSQPKGVCPKHMSFKLDDGKISDIKFVGGCPGNLSAVALLSEGRSALEVAKTLKGVKCGQRKTSCPAELSKAIMAALKDSKKAVPAKGSAKSLRDAPAPKAPKAPAAKVGAKVRAAAKEAAA
ncbi:MAG: TIGR03905 family TSCPD domain-containing protein [Deltaproteobacteria bacterium]|jgi:uncharacterized protein (TIGR03905 family)|nr:TIGR03905 family TSCPD domain-containing protein [Deltaproteobacteria bacterium]